MPERDAVRDALVSVFTHFPYSPELTIAAHRLIRALGLSLGSEAEAIADALLSRAQPERRTETYPHDCGCETCPEHTRAQPEGEPVAWGYACRVHYTDTVASDWWLRFRTEELPTSHQAQVVPLYTRPAPVVTEAMAIAAMREFSAQKGESHDALWSALDDKTRAELVSEWQHIVDCALAAARGEAQ